jgi:hypothetical protein
MFAASNQSLLLTEDLNFLFVTGGASGSHLNVTDYTASDYGFPCKTSFDKQTLPLGGSDSSGAFALASTDRRNTVSAVMVVVGGDYKKPDDPSRTSLNVTQRNGAHPFVPAFVVTPAQTPPHGYRSSVAYDPTTKTWITVGPNGTDISTDDGKNWRPLKPTASEPPDADQNWNALSLPFVVGPKGRIGKLRPTALSAPVKP